MASLAVKAPLRVRAGFRLDDGLGRDRKARATRRRAVFGDDVAHRANPGKRDDLLDGPSRRVGRGRASVSPSHEASRARTSHLRDAKRPTLGVLDELGGRADRRGKPERRLAAGPNGANTSGADVPYSVSSFAAAARWRRFAGTDFDVFDVPRGRARRGETQFTNDARATPNANAASRSTKSRRVSVRAAFARSAPRGADESAFGQKRDPTPPRHQRRVLGLLTAPSARVGRAARRAAAGGDGTRDRKEPRRGPYRAGADAAEPLLGILSGPGKRVGRKSK